MTESYKSKLIMLKNELLKDLNFASLNSSDEIVNQKFRDKLLYFIGFVSALVEQENDWINNNNLASKAYEVYGLEN